MKQRVFDILVCPYDKNWPLKVHIFDTNSLQNVNIPKKDEITGVVCIFYCSRKEIELVKEEKDGTRTLLDQAKQVDYETDCKECLSQEIVAGMIECPKCKNLYPIIDDIPLMLKAELRNEDIERQFTEKWAEKLKQIVPKKE